MVEKHPGRLRELVKAPYRKAVDALGKRMAKDPVLGPRLTAAARTEARNKLF